jgi:hypothetical protein
VPHTGNTGVREQEEKVTGRCWAVPLGANSEADDREKNSAEQITPGTALLQSTEIRAKSWIEKSLVAETTGAERRTQAMRRPENTSRRTKPATVTPEPKKLSCSKGPERSPAQGLEISPKLEARPQIWTKKITSAQRKKWTAQRMQHKFFSWNQNKIYIQPTEVTALPSSFNYWNENKFLTHFYSRKYEMKLESGKEPNPL